MKCSKCGKEVGELYCAKCRAEIEGKEANLTFERLIPLLYYDKVEKVYRAGCTVVMCPCNRDGICITKHLTIGSIKQMLHEFDGDNIVQQNCG